MSHIAVLETEVVRAFEGVAIATFFDGTVGAGGHASAILTAHPEIERYLACDRDPRAHLLAKKRLEPWGEKVEFIRGSYSSLEHFLDERKIARIDGFLIDIGVSSMQLDEAERGFSFRFEGPLDMRMDPSGGVTAESIVNSYPEKELEQIFREYGEEWQARKAAQAIVSARKKRPLRTTAELAKLLESVLHRGKIHPATKVFQALRIVVNDELGELERGLDAAIRRLSNGGRLAVISFHSLEDRIVKHRLKDQEYRMPKRSREAVGCLKILTKKPIEASIEESRKNPRSRSAKLRIAEKVGRES
ncbi:MAG: 16S rRNA (cytosine(1402)-N(4))-methyltransferase RsmH [Verrucomicrobiota bacterium]|nr:16S rRNA (cytosine(1402)-N(4))-methyltransferase RsmH [Verrucomicrobiota bacterium]